MKWNKKNGKANPLVKYAKAPSKPHNTPLIKLSEYLGSKIMLK
jgi:hypothetical protein